MTDKRIKQRLEFIENLLLVEPPVEGCNPEECTLIEDGKGCLPDDKCPYQQNRITVMVQLIDALKGMVHSHQAVFQALVDKGVVSEEDINQIHQKNLAKQLEERLLELLHRKTVLEEANTPETIVQPLYRMIHETETRLEALLRS